MVAYNIIRALVSVALYHAMLISSWRQLAAGQWGHDGRAKHARSFGSLCSANNKHICATHPTLRLLSENTGQHVCRSGHSKTLIWWRSCLWIPRARARRCIVIHTSACWVTIVLHAAALCGVFACTHVNRTCLDWWMRPFELQSHSIVCVA